MAVMFLVAIGPAPRAWAAVQGVDILNGIGLIDYASRPRFKVGSWVKYHVTGHSEMGASDDYTVTILIAGEERFWGENCFWVETWLQTRNEPMRAVASLMSYDVFTDSLPSIRMQYYMRKSIDGATDVNGELSEQVVRHPVSTLRNRSAAESGQDVVVDTLGADTVLVPPGAFHCRLIRYDQGKAASLDQRDSTVRTETRETRVTYYSPDIPVTGLARETVDRSIKRRTWAIGRSQEASPLNTMDHALGEARLIAFGEGLKSQILPEGRQKSLQEWDAEATRARAPAPRPPATPPPGKRKS
jgi:hypothetical protein